jgi:hypothetical protein
MYCPTEGCQYIKPDGSKVAAIQGQFCFPAGGGKPPNVCGSSGTCQVSRGWA